MHIRNRLIAFGTVLVVFAGCLTASMLPRAPAARADVARGPDIVASVVPATMRFTVGEAGSFTVMVRNAGDQASCGKIVLQLSPQGLTDTSASGDGWTCADATCTSAVVYDPSYKAVRRYLDA
jgi:hypothetical protein